MRVIHNYKVRWVVKITAARFILYKKCSILIPANGFVFLSICYTADHVVKPVRNTFYCCLIVIKQVVFIRNHYEIFE